MKEQIIKILQGDLEEERLDEICGVIEKELEWLRRRLHGHALVQYPVKNPAKIESHEKHVSLDYVDARIDDMKVYLRPSPSR